MEFRSMIYRILFIIACLNFLSCEILDKKIEISQGLHFFPSGLDPAKNTKFYEYQVFSQIYEPLLTLNKDYHTLYPCLAESWSVSEDNLTYTFHLKPDVYFHDGSKLTAEAAELSFLRQIQLQPGNVMFEMIDKIICVDSLTLQIKLKYPYLPFLYSMASPDGLMVISQRALEKYDDDIDWKPVGTGPFYLDQWRENRDITLKVFSDYRGSSTIDKIKFIISDSTSQPEDLYKNGELDILYLVAAQWLDRLKWLGKIEYFVQKPLSTLYLGFNLKNDPVNKYSVRRAILLAMDINKSVLRVNRGNALPAEGPLPPIYQGFDDLKQSSYDLESSKKLLDEAGYRNGLTLNFYVYTPSFGRQTKIELIKSQLEKIGIDLKTTFYKDWDTFENALNSPNCQLFLNGYGSELIGDPGNFLYALFHSDSPTNHFNYANKTVDRLLDRAFQEMNEEKRHETYRSVIKMILEDTPAIFESHVKSHFAYNSEKIKSLVVSPYDFIYFHRLEIYE